MNDELLNTFSSLLACCLLPASCDFMLDENDRSHDFFFDTLKFAKCNQISVKALVDSYYYHDKEYI